MLAADTQLDKAGAAELLARIREIADVLEGGALESENARRLATTSVDALHQAGLYRLWWPEALGGSGATLAAAVAVVEALAAIDTASAWNLGVGTLHGGFAGAYLSDQAVSSIFRSERVVIAGQMAPIGQATRIGDGLRVSGRWSFGSGVHQANWVLGGAIVREGDTVQPVIVFAPRSDATVDEGSWEVAGLAGTGSCDYSMKDVLVPAGFWHAFPRPQNVRGGAAADLPITTQVIVLHAGFALGAARRSLAEITELAKTKVRSTAKASIAHSATFQRELAEADAKLSAARLHMYDVCRRIESPNDPGAFATVCLEGRAATRYVTDVALDIATWAYRSGGGSSLRLTSQLQRVLRDLLVASQHMFVDDSAYVARGADLVGVPS